MGSRWGGVDGAHRWSEVVRWWSVMARQGVSDRRVGEGEMARGGVGVGGNSSTATTRKGKRAHGAVHVADVRGGAQATGAWPSYYRACARPAIGHGLSSA
jgi:hypothetical protein